MQHDLSFGNIITNKTLKIKNILQMQAFMKLENIFSEEMIKEK